MSFKFDVAKLERLNDPARFDDMDPQVMWSALGDPEPGVIVEIGAGTGMFAARFASYAPKAHVYAVDTEPVMIEWMREHRVPEVGERLEPVLSADDSVPLPDNVADIVMMINLHHEISQPGAMYAEVARLLAPGGSVLVVDWAPGADGKGPPQSIRASAADIAAALEGAGLTDVRIHEGLRRHTLVTAGWR